ncbi:MAG: hypothetical protein JNL58_19540 [Planctomyces sp.]|nr:hypothetical protein [Planctomyces sp.]
MFSILAVCSLGLHSTVVADENAATVSQYARQINEHFGKGVTPETNAVVAVYQAFGPHPENANLPPAFFRELGIPIPPEEGNYFKVKLEGMPSEEFNGQMDAAMEKPWTREQLPKMAEWIEKNAEPVRILTDGLDRPHWYSPMIPPDSVDGEQGTLAHVLLPAVQQLRAVARMLSCRAMLHAGEGRHEAAMRDVLLIHKLGRRSGEGTCLIEHLVGCAIQAIATDRTIALTRHHRLELDALQRIRAEFDRLPPVPKLQSQVSVTERAMVLELIDLMESGRYELLGLYSNEPPEKSAELMLSLIDYSVVRRRVFDEFSEFSEIMLTESIMDKSKLIASFRTRCETEAQLSIESLARNYLQERTISGALSGMAGDYVTTQTVLPLSQGLVANHRTVARDQLLKTMFALEVYERRNGRYPDSLSDIVPSVLAEPAIDPCSGEELRYQQTSTGYRLYSLGENCRDDAGQTFGETPSGDDLIVRMDRTTATASSP